MAEPQFIPLDQAYGGPPQAPPASDIIPLDQAYGGPPKATSPEEPLKPATKTVGDEWSNAPVRAMHAHHENSLLASSQFTTPDIEAHKKHYIGDAKFNERNEAGYLTDGKFNLTDRKKHVVLMDPEDAKYKVYERHPDTEEGPIKGRLLGLARALGIATMASAPAQMPGKVAPIVAAAERQGVDLPIGAAVPEGTAARTAAALTAKIPLTGGPQQKAASTAVSQIENRVGEVAADASRTGESVLSAEAGDALKRGVDAYVGPVTKAKIAEAYKKVDDLIPPNYSPSFQPAATTKMADQIATKYKNAGLDEPQSVAEILGPITQPKGHTYESLKFVRQNIGEMLRNPSKIDPKTNVTELRQLYGALSEDLRTLIQQGGNKAVAAFDRADRYTQMLHQRGRDLHSTLGISEKSNEAAFDKVLKLAGSNASADAELLGKVKRTLPVEIWQDVRSAAIDKMGMVNRAGNNPGTHFDGAQFVKKYEEMSEAGRVHIFGPKGTEVRQAMDDLNLINSKWPQLTKAAHPEGLLHSGGGYMMILEGLHDLHGLIAEGSWKKPAIAIGSLIGGRAISTVMARPAGGAVVSRWVKDYENLVAHGPSSNTISALNNSSKMLQELANAPQDNVENK